MNTQAYVFVPIGPSDLNRLAWKSEVLRGAIKFGVEVKAPEKFDGASQLGVPYALHAANEALTELWKAERGGKQSYITEFWERIKYWASWNPPPLYVVFHGAGLGTIPPIDEYRFNCPVEPGEWLARATWHEHVLERMQRLGLRQAVLETLYLCNYYGPPYFPAGWLPITYLSPRVGIYRDMVHITRNAGVGSLVDFEHLLSTVDTLNREMVELVEVNLDFAQPGTHPEFESYFGFVCEKDKACCAIGRASWEGLVSELRTPYYHVGGIQAQVVPLQPDETGTSYHRALQEALPDEYARRLVRSRRGGSHSSVELTDERFRQMLRHALQTAPSIPTFTIEVSSQDQGFWYWARPDALKCSFNNLLHILQEELATT